MKLKWLIFALVLVSLLIIPASAQTLTGSLGGTTTNSTEFSASGNVPYSGSFNVIIAHTIENSLGTKTLTRFDNGIKPSFSAGNIPGNTTPFSIYSGSQLIGNGTFGYARFWSNVGIELDGYQYYIFNDWNVTGLTGDQSLDVVMPQIDGISAPLLSHGNTLGNYPGKIAIGGTLGYDGSFVEGSYLDNVQVSTLNSYTATKPSGLSIEGYVFKHADGDSAIYPSRAYVFNGTDGSVITNDLTISAGFLYFNVPAQTIKIGIQDPLGNWYNSSVLFTVTTPTITPTPSITPLPNASPYALTLNPNAVPFNGNTTATISSISDPSLSDVTAINFFYQDENPNYIEFYVPGSSKYVMEFIKQGGTWYQFDKSLGTYSNSYGGNPAISLLQFLGSGGTKTVWAQVGTSTGQLYEMQGSVIVGQGQNYITTHVHAVDGDTGGQLFGPEIDILNENTGTWQNGTFNQGATQISTASNVIFSFYGHLQGYVDPALLLHVPASATTNYPLRFYTGTTPSAGNTSYHVTVQDGQGNPISGALVRMVYGTNTTTLTTPAGGMVTFTLKTDTIYTWSATKTGYVSGAGSFESPTGPSGSLIITLLKGSVQPTTVPTGVITSPTTLPNGSAGNYTGFWSPFYKGFAGMGATAAELGLIMTMCAILFGLVVMAVVTHGEPRAISIGGSFGLIFASMIGWVSIWLIAAGVAWAMMSMFTFRSQG